MWSLARRSAWAHRASLTGTVLVLALAGLLLAIAGVLAESGLDTGADATTPGSGLVLVLAGSFSGTVLTVVVLVVAATVSLALRGRQRELALLRTIGATRSQLRRQISAEVVIVGLVAAPVGATLGVLLSRGLDPLLRETGLIAPDGALLLTPLPVLSATVLVLPIAWLAARFASRETLRLAPGQAVRASTVEAGSIGVVRRGAALALALLGLGAALSPSVVPGAVGSASAAGSAFLLVGAAALAGPALLSWAFTRTASVERRLGPAGRLALGNLRGFSRRLTVVVVPLALALTAGTAQTTVDRTVSRASVVQLRDGLGADLVASTSSALSPSVIDSVGALPGVAGTTSLTSGAAQVLTEPDMDGVVDALAWEPTTVRSLRPGPTGLLVDPTVSAGSLRDLSGPDTVAVSRDATFATEVKVGTKVPLRWPNGTTSRPTVVAVYDRGLGFGDYLVGADGLAGKGTTPVGGSVLVTTSPGARADVRAGLGDLGLAAQTPAAYAASAADSDDAERTLSAVLLLALLAFVFLAAANALVMVTARRRSELGLLARTGATRAQLLRMAFIEAGLTGALAWAIGTLAVLPTVLGVGLGMLGPVLPPVDLTTYLALSAAVVVVPLLSVVPTVARLVSDRESLPRRKRGAPSDAP